MSYPLPDPWGYAVAMGIGLVIAVQSVVLKTFRESQYSSKTRFAPPWYLRALGFVIGLQHRWFLSERGCIAARSCPVVLVLIT